MTRPKQIPQGARLIHTILPWSPGYELQILVTAGVIAG